MMNFRELFTIQMGCGCEVQVVEGRLESPTGIDFRTKYLDHSITTRWRTPKHAHLVADIIAKGTAYPDLFPLLLEYFQEVLYTLRPLCDYPTPNDVGKINIPTQRALIRGMPDKHLFHIEDLLLVFELVVLQEVTRFPNGQLTAKILQHLADDDLYSAITTATFVR